MTDHHLAQINIGRMIGPGINDPSMKSFVDQLEAINALAETSPGFIWRFKEEGGNATAFDPYGDQKMIVNFSVWQDLASLEAYVYKSAHTEVMKNRRQWFERMEKPYYALWYVPAGHIPDFNEANDRLRYLQEYGPSPMAFDFRSKFSPV